MRTNGLIIDSTFPISESVLAKLTEFSFVIEVAHIDTQQISLRLKNTAFHTKASYQILQEVVYAEWFRCNPNIFWAEKSDAMLIVDVTFPLTEALRKPIMSLKSVWSVDYRGSRQIKVTLTHMHWPLFKLKNDLIEVFEDHVKVQNDVDRAKEGVTQS